MAHLLEESLGVDELGMSLDGRHGLHEADAGGVEGPDDEARESRRKRGGALAVLLGDGVPVLHMRDGRQEVLGRRREVREPVHGRYITTDLVLKGHQAFHDLYEAVPRREVQALSARTRSASVRRPSESE